MQDPETAALPAVPREPSGAAGRGRGGGAGGREDAEHPDRQLVRQQQQAAGVAPGSFVVLVQNETSRISSLSVSCMYLSREEQGLWVREETCFVGRGPKPQQF